MPQEPQKRWIVVLDKVPRGPLTAEEVLALLDQGILRHNDMGFEVAPDGETASRESSQWRLLWQFPEFDRRGREGEGGDNPPPPERRHLRGGTTKPAEDPVKLPDPVAPSELPPEALDIDIEQLVPQRRSAPVESRDGEDWGAGVQLSQEGDSDTTKMWIGLSVGLLLSSVVLFAWLGSSPTPTRSRQAASAPSPEPTQGAPARRRVRAQPDRAVRPRPRRMPARTPVVTPTQTPSAPVRPKPRQIDEDDRYLDEPDRGEILEEMDEEFVEEGARPRIRRPRRRPDRVPYDDEVPPGEEDYEDYPPDTPPQELMDDANWDNAPRDEDF